MVVPVIVRMTACMKMTVPVRVVVVMMAVVSKAGMIMQMVVTVRVFLRMMNVPVIVRMVFCVQMAVVVIVIFASIGNFRHQRTEPLSEHE